MHDPTDKDPFWTAMSRLSTALSIELSEDRVAVYWDALCDLRIESVCAACQHAARYWKPTTEERKPFPTPATLREYAQQYREAQIQRATQEARALLPTWSSTPDDEGLQAIRKILTMLGDTMDMASQAPHPVYQYPSSDDPDKRRAELVEQARLIMHQEPEETA